MRQRVPAWLIAATFGLVWLIAIDILVIAPMVRPKPQASDFRVYYAGAYLGTHYGWNRLYDLDLQRQVQRDLSPPLDLNLSWIDGEPPPAEWLAIPFLALPPLAGYVAFDILLLAAWLSMLWFLVPYGGWRRAALLLLGTGIYSTAVSLRLGQNALLVAAAIGGAYVLSERRRHVLAGLCLSLLVLKPHTALIVPFAFLAAGRVRTFLVTLAAGVVMAVLSFLSVGLPGWRAYEAGLASAYDIQLNYYLTLRYPFGDTWGAVAGAACLVAGLAILWFRRGSPLAGLLAGALFASTLSAPWLHGQDLSLAVLAGYLWIREESPRAGIALILATELVTTFGSLYWIALQLAGAVQSARLTLRSRGSPGAAAAVPEPAPAA